MDFTNMAIGIIVFMVAIGIAILFAFVIMVSTLISKGKEFAQKITDSTKREAREALNRQLLEERQMEENLINQKIKKSLNRISQNINREDLTKKLGIDDSLGIEVENVDGVEKYHQLLDNDVRYNLSLEESQQTIDMLKDLTKEVDGWEGNILRTISNREGKNLILQVKNGELSKQDQANGYFSKKEYDIAIRRFFDNDQIQTLKESGEVTKTQNIGEVTIFITARKADEMNSDLIIFGWIPKKVYIETATGRVVATEELDETFSQFHTDFSEFNVDLSEYDVDFSEISKDINLSDHSR